MGITYRILKEHQWCSTKEEWLKRLTALNEFTKDMLRQLRILGCADHYRASGYDKDKDGEPMIRQLRVCLNPPQEPFYYVPIAGNYVSERTRDSWHVTEDDVPNWTLETLYFKLDYFGIRFLDPIGNLETFSTADWNFSSEYEKSMSEWCETFYEGPDVLDVGSTLFWSEIEDARKHVVPTVEMILRKYRIWLNAERMQEIKDAGKQFTA
jgi:hypothetical protein